MSGFNISQFKAQGLPLGGQRPSLFQVRFPTMPSGVPNISAGLSFVAKSAQIPSSIIQPIEQRYFGRATKFAGDREFQDWTITVINDEDMAIRNMFEIWHNKINALQSNRQDSPSDDLMDYKIEAQVLQYGKAGPGDDSGVVRGYNFVGMFPTVIDAQPLDWDSTNQIGTFDVTFSYDFWEPIIFHPNATPYTGILAPDPAQTNPAVSG